MLYPICVYHFFIYSEGGGSAGVGKNVGSRPIVGYHSMLCLNLLGAKRGYTPEQESGAKKILTLSQKSHYEVLGVSRDADEARIKTAYRKLALKYHPDKNTAPSAEAAFKAISTAFDTLSDSVKRETYDQLGHDAASNGGMDGSGMQSPFAQAFRSGGFRRGGGFGAAQEISPEDLFRMFFQGQGMHFHMHQQRQRYQQPEEQQQQQQQQSEGRQTAHQSPLIQVIQFLPILVLLLMSMSSFTGGGSQQVYSFSPHGSFNQPRRTSTRSVIKGIPYYVSSAFDRSYPPSSQSLQRVEEHVQEDYKSVLIEQCQSERHRRNVMIQRVSHMHGYIYIYMFIMYICLSYLLFIVVPQTVWSSAQEREKARALPTPSCDKFQDVFVNRKAIIHDGSEF